MSPRFQNSGPGLGATLLLRLLQAPQPASVCRFNGTVWGRFQAHFSWVLSRKSSGGPGVPGSLLGRVGVRGGARAPPCGNSWVQLPVGAGEQSRAATARSVRSEDRGPTRLQLAAQDGPTHD